MLLPLLASALRHQTTLDITDALPNSIRRRISTRGQNNLRRLEPPYADRIPQAARPSHTPHRRTWPNNGLAPPIRRIALESTSIMGGRNTRRRPSSAPVTRPSVALRGMLADPSKHARLRSPLPSRTSASPRGPMPCTSSPTPSNRPSVPKTADGKTLSKGRLRPAAWFDLGRLRRRGRRRPARSARECLRHVRSMALRRTAQPMRGRAA